MLDQIRKFSLYLVLCSQRLGHLDDDILDAVLTNWRVKAVFGGLSAKSARVMAEELFLGKLDAKKIKLSIYQTKFWPKYQRDKVYTRGSSQGSTTGYSSSSGGGDTSGHTSIRGASTSMVFDSWFSFPQLSSARTESSSNSTGYNSSHSSSWGESVSDSSSFTESESVADIPIFVPMPFTELSNVQYYTPEEQLIELTAALKEQFSRHCFIKIQSQETQPLLVPFIDPIRSFSDSRENLDWYQQWQWNREGALPVVEVDRLLEEHKTALLQASSSSRIIEATPVDQDHDSAIVSAPLARTHRAPERKLRHSIWNRSAQGEA